MARTDGDLNINTKINTDGVDKELNNLKNKLSKVSGTNFIKGITGLGAAFAGVTTAVKAANKAIKETSALYRVQATAEKQLEIAAKNNPYLNEQNVKALKDYASQLQNIGTVGDETIIPFMAQLASAGRSQEEIQKILAASLDISAAGVMSLDQAVTQLNATYSGNIGLLGRQYSDLKNLTDEELKSGKAVDVLAQKFKGVAEETAKATGTSEQLKNAIGDFKEEIGASFEKNMSPMRAFFTELITGWTDAAKARRGYEEAKDKSPEERNIEDLINLIEGEKKKLDELEKGVVKSESKKKTIFENIRDSIFIASTGSVGVSAVEITKGNDTEIEAQKQIIANYEEQLKLAKDKLDADTKARIEAEAKAKAEQDAANATLKAQQDRTNFIKDNENALNKELEQMRIKAELRGEEVDEQEVLNALMSSYIDLVTSGVIDEDDVYSKERLESLKEYASGIKEVTYNYDELLETIKDFLGDGDGAKLSDSIQTTIDALQEESAALDKNSEAWAKNAQKVEELEKLKTKVVKKEADLQTAETIKQAQSIVGSISEYINQFASIVNSITQLAAKHSEQETQKALGDLSDQYNNGLVSYEEYCNKKREISKKAAQAQYRQEMWQYSTNILTATANAALAVLKAYADFGEVGAAIAATAGALQVATVVANKPQMPAFKNGGIVGGNNYNDGILARVSSREMVLTQAQQAQLFKMANGGGGNGINLKVINNRGNDTKVGATMTASGLEVTVDALVNKSFLNGSYNKTIDYANNNANGVRIL